MLAGGWSGFVVELGDTDADCVVAQLPVRINAIVATPDRTAASVVTAPSTCIYVATLRL